MSRHPDPDELQELTDRFAEDLRTAFPAPELPHDMVEEHVASMVAAARLITEDETGHPEPVDRPIPALDGRPISTRRNRMRQRMIRRVVAATAAILLSLGGLAFAGSFSGTDDPADDDVAVVTDLPEDDLDDLDADDQDEADDDQGEDADDQDEADDDQGEDADDQGEADDQDEADDDQGEDGDDQGEDGDDQGEDGDDQDEDGDDQDEADDDQGGDDEDQDEADEDSQD